MYTERERPRRQRGYWDQYSITTSGEYKHTSGQYLVNLGTGTRPRPDLDWASQRRSSETANHTTIKL